jgi:hypothetical protein
MEANQHGDIQSPAADDSVGMGLVTERGRVP